MANAIITPLTMASKGYIMPIVHVLNDGDVALGGRRSLCWPFFKQTKYLLQLIAINEIEIYFIIFAVFIHPPPSSCCSHAPSINS